jgi:dihydrofolate synthase/folylpolyglutamate synthase
LADDLSEYQDAVDSLFARVTGATKFGLERTEQLLHKLGNPEKKFPSIHVAGTNGKGSVVATLDALLLHKGLKVGRYTSPHLIDFRERIVVNGVQISEREVLDFLRANQSFAEEIGATFFELTTALAFAHFAASQVDIAVIETGLGGRLDSTNVLQPLASVVTSIGLDHMDLLGDTLEKIAEEKAGIFKPNSAAVIGEADPAIAEFLGLRAAAAGSSPIAILDRTVEIKNIGLDSTGTTFELTGEISGSFATQLVGAHQARNTVLALLTTLRLPEQFRIPESEWNQALSKVSLPGRFQRFEKYIFDVAHNPDGAAALAATIIELNPAHPRTALVAVLGDKDWQGIMRAIAPSVDRLFITTPPGAPAGREFDPNAAYEYAIAQNWNAELDTNFDDAITRMSKRCGTIIITGSFHTVGAAMKRLLRYPATA